MTFKDLKEKLDAMTAEQLNQEVKFITHSAFDDGSITLFTENGVISTPCSLEVAEYPLYYLISEGNYGLSDSGIPDIPREEAGIRDSDTVVDIGIDTGMPHFVFEVDE